MNIHIQICTGAEKRKMLQGCNVVFANQPDKVRSTWQCPDQVINDSYSGYMVLLNEYRALLSEHRALLSEITYERNIMQSMWRCVDQKSWFVRMKEIPSDSCTHVKRDLQKRPTKEAYKRGLPEHVAMRRWRVVIRLDDEFSCFWGMSHTLM